MMGKPEVLSTSSQVSVDRWEDHGKQGLRIDERAERRRYPLFPQLYKYR
jgi:hypothetical protein